MTSDNSTTPPARHRVAVVGSLTRDVVTLEGRRATQIGGVVWHAAAILAGLGVETAIATCLAPGDSKLRAALAARGIALHGQDDAATTVFHNDYDAEGARSQRVGHVAAPIRAPAITRAIAGADFVHLGPLHPDDIAPDGIAAVLDSGARIALDAQGYTRAIAAGRVVPALSERLAELLPACAILKADRGEAALIVGSDDPMLAAGRLAARHPAMEVLITCSLDGIVLAAEGAVHRLECTPVDTLDPTGAGDVFLASYLRARLGAEAPRVAADFALANTAAELAAPSRLVGIDEVDWP